MALHWMYVDGKGHKVNGAVVDTQMRKFFCEPPSDTDYLGGWFDLFMLGKSWQEYREQFKDYPGTIAIIDYLDHAGITVDSWAQRG